MKKLITPLIQSQRDSRWASVILGNNTLPQYDIGDYGCLITSLGNYLGLTPTEVNNHKDLFTDKSGDFIWSKITVLGLNPVYTSPRYENEATTQALNKMRELLDEGLPLLCEIDFYPVTPNEEMHFVLVIGYDDNDKFIAIDPWTGSEIDLSVYGGVKRTLYCFRAYDKILPFYTVAVSDDIFKKKIQEYFNLDITADDVIKFIDERKTEISKLNTAITEKDLTINNLNIQINKLKSDNLILADKLSACEKSGEANIELNDKLLQLTQELNQLKLNYEKLKSDYDLMIVAKNNQITQLTNKFNATKSSIKKLLIDYIFGKK